MVKDRKVITSLMTNTAFLKSIKEEGNGSSGIKNN